MGFLEFIYCTFVVAVVIQIIFYLFIFRKFAFYPEQKPSSKSIPISVIVCAKNEAQNLKRFLPSIIEQEYPDFEIVLVNDASSDGTLDVMEDFARLHQNIKLVNVKNVEAFWGNKKYALTLGIKASQNEHLLFTDADCKPASKYWLKHMSAHFSDKTSIVLGYGSYAKIKNSLLNKMVRFETLTTAVHYFSMALVGLPYMGVGRNLAYSKKVFFKANGFIKHMKMRSGDDDLFINQVANKSNTAVCISNKSFTISTPKTTFKDWFRQKRRHVSTAKYYKPKHKIILALLYISNFLFWVLGLSLISTLFNWQIVLALFLLRICVQYVILGPISKKLDEKDLLFLFPLLEIFLIAAQMLIFINNLISKPKHWN